MYYPLLFLYWVIFFHCHHMCDQLLLLNFDEIIFTHLYCFHNCFVIDTTTWLCISFCLKLTSVLNELLVWTSIWGRFEYPITLSLFDVFKLSDLIKLTCELTVVHILLLDLYETLLSCFPLDYVNTMNIYFTSVKYYLSTIKDKLENS